MTAETFNTLFSAGGSLDLIPLILAFLTGIVGASYSGQAAFIFTGFTGLASLGVMAAGSGAAQSVAFGFWWHPAMAFFASVVAVAYAGKRGYVANGKAIDLPLISLKKPDVLLVGGVSALVGYFVMQLLTSPTFLGIKADGGAITIFVLSLVAKLWIDNGHLMGKVPDEIKAQGGRFGSNHDS